jgi:glutamyl-tRNA reductase
MQNKFKAYIITHHSAPLEVREKVSLNEASTLRLLHFLKEYTDASDVLVLSTCNRTEVYYSSDKDLGEDILKLICIEKNLSDISSYKQYFINLLDTESTIRHLFRVSLGLEAQVVGDMQISNQVKRAYQQSADENMAGPYLHRLMHTIFFSSKRVVQETSFRDGAASVSYATVDLINDLTKEIIKPKVLVFGLGEIGEDVCKNLVNAPSAEVYITNRTMSKAENLAQECGFKTLEFSNWENHLSDFDVIISSVSAEKPLFTAELLQKIEILSYKFLFDLSVPRSIEPEVEHIPGVLLYNIDGIRSRTNEALEKRVAAIPAVEAIIEEAIAEFGDWSKEMIVSPTIQKLKNALEQIRLEEVAKYTKNLDEKQLKDLEKVTKGMMQKIIKLPVLQLKAACKRGDAENLIDVLTDLFDLEKVNQEEKH